MSNISTLSYFADLALMSRSVSGMSKSGSGSYTVTLSRHGTASFRDGQVRLCIYRAICVTVIDINRVDLANILMCGIALPLRRRREAPISVPAHMSPLIGKNMRMHLQAILSFLAES